MHINIGVISLGCPKNLVDTEVILGNLSRQGYNITNKVEQADVIIINTCGFIHDAKQESINTILEMAEHRTKGNCRALLVIGCLAERYKEDIYREIPEVDAVITIKEYVQIPEVISSLVKAGKEKKIIPYEENYLNRVRSTLPFISYLKISEGCDNRCSYCVIPFIRGAYRSRNIDDILDEARHLSNYGVKELIIIAQDTTKYGIDVYGEPKLAELLKKLCRVEGIEWIRFLYAYPDSVTDELIEVMVQEEKICKYIDLPIQHISDNVLKAMARKSKSTQIKQVIKKLRDNIPDIAIRTSIIVGFPGETEEDFDELLNFIQETKFDRLGVFTYSKEEGTVAAKLSNQVPYKVKKARQSKIMKIQKEISKSINQGHIGKSMKVLIEGRNQTHNYFGRTFRDAPEIDGIVYVKSEKDLAIGSIEEVCIKKTSQYDLIGGVNNESCK